MSYIRLAEQFGVVPGTTFAVVQGRSWHHVQDTEEKATAVSTD